MKNTIRKFSTVLLALTMIFAMSISTFAASGPDNTNGNFGPKNKGESTGGTYVLNQEEFTSGITEATFNVHFQLKDTNAKRPQTKFTYSIDNGTAVAATSTTPAINAGVTDGATLAATETDAWNSPNAADETDTVGLTFDKTKFSQPGIYRYVLTETALTGEQTDIGIKDGDTSGNHTENTLYLDVYVTNVNDVKTVVAAVLSTTTDAPTLRHESGSIENTNETAAYTTKIDGFYNCYESFQVTLTKTVTGSMGDKNKFFPFSLNLGYVEGLDANTTITGVEVNVAATANSTVGSTYTIGNSTGSVYSDITMKDGGTVTITGLPKKTVMKLMETVDAGEGYNITSAVTNMASTAARTAEDGTHTESAFVTTGTVDGTDGANMAYTNNRTSISPTNVVMRFAPYLFILAAGMMLLMVSRRRKAEQE